MLIYALKRLSYVALILAVMSVLIFWATQVMPGDVAQMIVGQFASLYYGYDERMKAHEQRRVEATRKGRPAGETKLR